MQRILAVQYTIPPHLKLSESCVDLLRRIFVPDPAQRISLAQMRQHPWFLVNLRKEFQVGRFCLCVKPCHQQARLAAAARPCWCPAATSAQQPPLLALGPHIARGLSPSLPCTPGRVVDCRVHC